MHVLGIKLAIGIIASVSYTQGNTVRLFDIDIPGGCFYLFFNSIDFVYCIIFVLSLEYIFYDEEDFQRRVHE